MADRHRLVGRARVKVHVRDQGVPDYFMHIWPGREMFLETDSALALIASAPEGSLEYPEELMAKPERKPERKEGEDPGKKRGRR